MMKANGSITNVIAPESRVRIGPDKKIQGTVIDVSIRSGGVVQYRVIWWSGNERKNECLEACEVHHEESATVQQIGFASVR
jgi:hypothetical protein